MKCKQRSCRRLSARQEDRALKVARNFHDALRQEEEHGRKALSVDIAGDDEDGVAVNGGGDDPPPPYDGGGGEGGPGPFFIGLVFVILGLLTK